MRMFLLLVSFWFLCFQFFTFELYFIYNFQIFFSLYVFLYTNMWFHVFLMINNIYVFSLLSSCVFPSLMVFCFVVCFVVNVCLVLNIIVWLIVYFNISGISSRCLAYHVVFYMFIKLLNHMWEILIFWCICILTLYIAASMSYPYLQILSLTFPVPAPVPAPVPVFCPRLGLGTT